MSTTSLERCNASPNVGTVCDDITPTDRVSWLQNFWKSLAHDPVTLARIWSNVRTVTYPGALHCLTARLAEAPGVFGLQGKLSGGTPEAVASARELT